ncbi:Tyrosine recombinase XerC [subsurface metagenome]
MEKVLTAIILDTRRSKMDNTYPVKLRVTYQRERKYYNTGYSLTKEDFNRVIGKPRGELKDSRLRLNKIEQDAINIIDKLDVFSFRGFKKYFSRTPGDHADLFFSFREHIRKLKINGQIGTASTYETSFKSWQKFIPRHKLPYKNITPDVLNNYEKYLLSEGKSPTTVSINARCIRRLFNLAIMTGDVDKALYPFGDKEVGLYQPPQHRNIKKALSKSDIKKIFDYNPPEGSSEHFYRDLWLFSYLCNGANLADICRLRYSNIQSDKIIFIRHKTAHNRKIKPVLVSLTGPVRDIIDRWGTKPVIRDKYVFKILSDSLDPAKEVARIKQATKMCNTYLKRIAHKLGITDNISTYTARHSFATVLKLAGESVEFISESLGHSNLRTTENYLSSFDDKKRKEAAKKLTDFNI